MSLSARDVHTFQLLIVFILVTITFYYLFLEDRYDVVEVARALVVGKKQTFIEDLVSSNIDGPFDGSALADVCNTKTWIPGLIFKCEPPQGGLTNVRNIFLNCVRYAVEAGATGFVVPEIMVRRPKYASLNELHAQRLVPFTYFFDQTHFKSTLSASCPQIHIYDHQNDLWDVPSTATPVGLQPSSLTSHFYKGAETVMLSPANWTNAFNEQLNTSHPRQFSASMPVLVSVHNPLLQWPIDYDSPTFITSFGRILRANEDLRKLAATVLYAMNDNYHLDLDPAFPGIQEGKFYGAHLRTAVDAVKAGWTSYETQSENYVSEAANVRLPVIYLSSDSPSDEVKFIDRASNHSFPMEVTTKNLLLAGKGFGVERAEMAELTLDQQLAVDYEVMLRASRVGGTWESSFGWNLAMRRHIVAGRGTWVPLRAGDPDDLIADFENSSPKANHPGTKPSKSATIIHGNADKTASPKDSVAKAQSSASSKTQGPTNESSEIDFGDFEKSTDHAKNAGEGKSREGLPERRDATDKRVGALDNQPLKDSRSFSDSYSTIFGDVLPGDQPGVVFQLALWP